jgi:hypothetical protein
VHLAQRVEADGRLGSTRARANNTHWRIRRQAVSKASRRRKSSGPTPTLASFARAAVAVEERRGSLRITRARARGRSCLLRQAGFSDALTSRPRQPRLAFFTGSPRAGARRSPSDLEGQIGRAAASDQPLQNVGVDFSAMGDQRRLWLVEAQTARVGVTPAAHFLEPLGLRGCSDAVNLGGPQATNSSS